MSEDRVLVTGASSRHGIYIVSLLIEAGFRVIVSSSYPLSPAFYIRGIEGKRVHPVPYSFPDAFIQWALDEAQRSGVSVLLPLFEETYILAVVKDLFDKKGIELVVPSLEHVTLFYYKRRMLDIAKKRGVEIPFTLLVESLDDAFDMADEVGYPLLVKPAYGFHGAGIRYVKDRRGLRPAIMYSMRDSPYEFGRYPYLQRYVKGSPYSIAMAMGRDGEEVHFAYRFLSTYPPEFGCSVESELVEEEESAMILYRFLRSLSFKGIAWADFIVSEDGRHLLLEINPRMGSGILVEGGSPIDFVAEAMRILTHLESKGIHKRSKPGRTISFLSMLRLSLDAMKKGRIKDGIDYLTKALPSNRAMIEEPLTIESGIRLPTLYLFSRVLNLLGIFDVDEHINIKGSTDLFGYFLFRRGFFFENG